MDLHPVWFVFYLSSQCLNVQKNIIEHFQSMPYLIVNTHRHNQIQTDVPKCQTSVIMTTNMV